MSIKNPKYAPSQGKKSLGLNIVTRGRKITNILEKITFEKLTKELIEKKILMLLGYTDDLYYPRIFIRLKEDGIEFINFLKVCLESYVDDNLEFRKFVISKKKIGMIGEITKERIMTERSEEMRKLYDSLCLTEEEYEILFDVSRK